MPAPYQDPLAAALAGLASCYETMPRDAECGYGVYKDADGKFYTTPVQSGGARGIDGMALRIPKTATLTGLGHTHPKDPHKADGDNSRAFSKEDIAFAKRTGLDMYLGSERSGQAVHYKEGQSKAERNSTLGRIAYGEPIGTYDGKPLETRRDQLAQAYDQAVTGAR